MGDLRVLALVPYPTGHVPGQRYRIEQWAPLLRAEAVQVTFSPFLSSRAMDLLYRPGHLGAKLRESARGYLTRLVEVIRSSRADLVFVYREASLLGPAWIERLHARRLPLVFDFDDAIYLRDSSPANAWSRLLKLPGKPRAICRLARHVIVGNDVLATFATAHARDVTVVPSTIDTDVYQVRERPPNPRPVVGWTGSVTTVRYLAALGPALRRLRERVDFELLVIGGQVEIQGVEVRCVPWRPTTEADDLRSADVGLMPLSEDEWSRGKCGMKALQYMALGIPPVVAPVGVNARIVRDGVDGFHARRDGEWVERIAELLGDAALRHRMGAAARRSVEDAYSARVHAPRVARILREAAG
jgi:glycosyltransferase involved in cell wall biosynthesis